MRMQQRTLSRLFVLVTALWCIGFAFGPAVEQAIAGTQHSSTFYQQICHQDPARSFSWFGAQWAVCHRCSAIYLSFAIAAIIVIRRGRFSLDKLPRPGILAALLLPIVIDGMTDLIGIRSADLSTRVVTGGLTGTVLAIVVIPLLFDAVQKLQGVEIKPSSGGNDV